MSAPARDSPGGRDRSGPVRAVRDPALRPARVEDLPALFRVRASTRQNALSEADLAARGITRDSLHAAMARGDFATWLCEVDGEVVGFCTADAATGEVGALAVQAGFEGRGIGRALLAAAVGFLRAAGCRRPWLMAGADPALRSHGFYRVQGWQATGRVDARGDEEMRLPAHGAAGTTATPEPGER